MKELSLLAHKFAMKLGLESHYMIPGSDELDMVSEERYIPNDVPSDNHLKYDYNFHSSIKMQMRAIKDNLVELSGSLDMDDTRAALEEINTMQLSLAHLTRMISQKARKSA